MNGAGDGLEVSALTEVREANEALRNVLASTSVPAEAFGLEVRSAVHGLAAALEKHSEAAEAPGGNLEFVVAQKPALIPMVDRQREEHADMASRTSFIDGAVAEQLAFDRVDADMLVLETRVLCDIVELHIARAADMLYEAMNTVEGGEQG